MTPEIQELVSLRSIILFVGSVVMTVLVSAARVFRERAVQRREGKPLTTLSEGLADVIYGSFAALAMLFIQDAAKPLQIKFALGLAMFYGSIGPATWDLVSGLLKGQYAITKKEA